MELAARPGSQVESSFAPGAEVWSSQAPGRSQAVPEGTLALLPIGGDDGRNLSMAPLTVTYKLFLFSKDSSQGPTNTYLVGMSDGQTRAHRWCVTLIPPACQPLKLSQRLLACWRFRFLLQGVCEVLEFSATSKYYLFTENSVLPSYVPL